MSLDESKRDIWIASQNRFSERRASSSDTPLNPPSGGGTSGGMESRIATLEAHMEQVKESLAKLTSVPEDLATLKERTSHLSTKAELHTEITTQLDRLGTRLQRQVVITGSIFTAILALITLADRILK